MLNSHSTISRREFMKGLGLAGVGVSTIAGPSFHDLDEVLSSPSAITQKPWWVKQADVPTTPIDWTMLPARRPKPANAVVWRTKQQQLDLMTSYYQNLYPDWKVAGWSGAIGTSYGFGDIRWDALSNCHQGMGIIPAVVGTATGNKYTNMYSNARAGWRPQPKPLDRGYSSIWQGTPEENLKICTAAMRLSGADDVGAIPIDDHFQKVMWTQNGSTTFEFGAVDDFVMTPDTINPTKIVIPNKVKWVLTWTVRQFYWQGVPYAAVNAFEQLMGEHAPACLLTMAAQNFLWGLGYISLNDMQCFYAPTGFFPIMSGAGEMPRQGSSLHPKYGLSLRRTDAVITDLPLAETTPIDFGGREFCKSCGICAEMCPYGAIAKKEVEPWWEAGIDSHNGGYLTWRPDQKNCSHCPVCMAVCPFNSVDKSMVHSLVRTTAATTSIFNGFFAGMQGAFGYGLKPPDDFWKLENIVPGGVDTSY